MSRNRKVTRWSLAIVSAAAFAIGAFAPAAVRAVKNGVIATVAAQDPVPPPTQDPADPAAGRGAGRGQAAAAAVRAGRDQRVQDRRRRVQGPSRPVERHRLGPVRDSPEGARQGFRLEREPEEDDARRRLRRAERQQPRRSLESSAATGCCCSKASITASRPMPATRSQAPSPTPTIPRSSGRCRCWRTDQTSERRRRCHAARDGWPGQPARVLGARRHRRPRAWRLTARSSSEPFRFRRT